MILFSLAGRGLARELRAGELRVLIVALMVAVAAVSAVGSFTDRVERAMSGQAAQLLAADLVLTSSRPIAAERRAAARALGLSTVDMVQFPTVILVPGDETELVALKAVSAGYPLRGEMRVSNDPYGAEFVARAVPSRGHVWLESRLFAPLGLRTGDRVSLGAREFVIERAIAYEPDRGGDLFSLAPRVLINLDDLAATELVTPASRVRYNLLLAGSSRAIDGFRQEVEPKLDDVSHFHGVRDARPEMRAALDRAGSFLGLAAVVAVLLAGAAVAVAANRYSERQADASAVMRCLGASQALVMQMILLRLSLIAVIAVCSGLVLGYLTQSGLARLAQGFFELDLPPPSLQPMLAGFFTGFVTLIGFALPPLLRLRRVPVLRVMRRELGMVPPSAVLILLFGLAAMAVLVYWQAGDTRLAGLVVGGTLATLVVLTLAASALVSGLRLMRFKTTSSWRFGMASLSRRGASSVVQMVAFGIGIMALLLLAVVRVDIISAWETSLPEDTPDHFIINIPPDQVDDLGRRLEAAQVRVQGLFPMVRGRLIGINDQPVEPEQYQNPRAERLAAREFNLSWSSTRPPHNPVLAGEWWPADSDLELLSIEQGIAELLGVNLGDELRFNIGGSEIRARVANLRQVEWDSFEVNFFVIFSPAVLREFPSTYITSFRLPESQRDLIGRLVREFPSITVLDVRVIMQQVRAIMDRATLAVEYVFVFTLIAGLVVLYAAVQSSGAERMRENAILRALGASRRQVQLGLAAEFVTLGLLAGVLAATAAGAVGWVLARELFELDYSLNPLLWLVGSLGGGLGIGFAGLVATRQVLQRSPMDSLRRV